jgi:hypothetical protein
MLCISCGITRIVTYCIYLCQQEGISVQKQLDSDLHVSSDGKQLHLMHALTTNSGNYSCVAENLAGSKELQFEVNVLGKLLFLVMCYSISLIFLMQSDLWYKLV